MIPRIPSQAISFILSSFFSSSFVFTYTRTAAVCTTLPHRYMLRHGFAHCITDAQPFISRSFFTDRQATPLATDFFAYAVIQRLFSVSPSALECIPHCVASLLVLYLARRFGIFSICSGTHDEYIYISLHLRLQVLDCIKL